MRHKIGRLVAGAVTVWIARLFSGRLRDPDFSPNWVNVYSRVLRLPCCPCLNFKSIIKSTTPTT